MYDRNKLTLVIIMQQMRKSIKLRIKNDIRNFMVNLKTNAPLIQKFWILTINKQ